MNSAPELSRAGYRAYGVYVDAANGNDATAALDDATRPAKTLDAAFGLVDDIVRQWGECDIYLKPGTYSGNTRRAGTYRIHGKATWTATGSGTVLDASDIVTLSPAPGDNRGRIQTVLDMLEASGGGRLLLQAGVYGIVTVNSPSGSGLSGGAYGLEIPSNVTLEGVGSSTIIRGTAGGSFGTGAILTGKGQRTATADYGGAANVVLRNFKVESSDQAASSGNLVNVVHASDWLIEGLTIGSSLYHGAEIDQSRRVVFSGCRFDGSHTGGSGNHVQLDTGDAGSKSTVPTGITNQDILFSRCTFAQRAAGEGSAQCVEMIHSATQMLERVTFADCHFAGRATAFSMSVGILGASVTSGGMRDVRFLRCTFVTSHYQAWAIQMSTSTGAVLFDGLTVEGCTFSGPSATVLWAYGISTPTTDIANNYRRGLRVENNRFDFDATGMPGSAADFTHLLFCQWSGAVVQNNIFTKTGEFPAGWLLSSAGSVIRIGNCRDMVCDGNNVRWYGNNSASGVKAAIYWSQQATDTAATSWRTYCRDNTVWSESANWGYGVLKQLHTSTVSGRQDAFTGNWSNAASSGANNTVQTGTP